MNVWENALFVESVFLFLGLVMGSFTTMLVHRLYLDEGGIFFGRSKCRSCSVVLKWHNLIPVISWVMQRGKCKNCGKEISAFYPLVELSFALCFFLVARYMWGTDQFWWILGVVFFALVLFWYDVRYMTVDRRVSIPAIFFVLCWAFWQSWGGAELGRGGEFSFWSGFAPSLLRPYLYGAVVCGAIYFVQYFCSKGRWVGQGDIDLGVFVGLCLGLKLGLLSLFVAYLFGMVYALLLLGYQELHHKNKKAVKNWKNTKVPMGAFLMPSLILFLFMGEQIWDWYWTTFITGSISL